MRRLRTVWAGLKARAFPPGAITFHLGAWSRGALSEVEGKTARALLDELGFQRLFVLHGSAVQLGTETVVVVGSRGIGKSTACRNLVRHGGAVLVEDGLVLAGEADGRWTLIETGTLGVLRRAALLAAAPRRFLPSPGALTPRTAGRRSGKGLPRFHRALEGLAFRGGVLFSQRRKEPMVRRLLPIDRLVVAEYPESPSGSWETDGRTMSAVADVETRIPAGTTVRRPAVTGSRPDVLLRLEGALRR
ncbi:MAG: hypothetical protein IPL90_06970 [Holophagales bacterium]|nr:hypothetical protein [Holophagales bacterium]